MRQYCPHCGAPETNALEEKVALLRMSGTMMMILHVLAKADGKTVPYDRLIKQVYGHRRDGGPTNAQNQFHVYRHRSRKELAQNGLVIGSIPRFGLYLECLPEHGDG